MNSTSPANSSVSTTAIVGGERGGGSGGGGGGSGGASSLEDFNFHFPCDDLSLQDRKEEAILVLRTELMASLNDEVKSLDEDNWMFEAPRSRIHLISRPSGFRSKMEITKNKNQPPPK